MIVSPRLSREARALVARFFPVSERFIYHLAAGPELSQSAVEALAVYGYNQQAVPQEIFHPGGEVERHGPLNPDFLSADTSRLLYQAVAWYQQMETRLKRIDGDWESWTEGVFSFLRRDEGQTIYWTVCDLVDAPFSRWTLQIECEGVLEQSLTFVAANESVTGARAKPRSRDERVLLDAYQVYSRRIYRILHLLRHLQTLGMRSTQEYRGWCANRGLGDELLKSPQQRRRELALVGAQAAQQGGVWFRAVAR